MFMGWQRGKNFTSLLMIFLIVIALMFFVDLYTFKGIKVLMSNVKSDTIKQILYSVFWFTSIAMLLMVFTGYFFRSNTRNFTLFTFYYYIFGAFLIFYVPKILFIVFHFADDILFATRWIINKIQVSGTLAETTGNPITRTKFLSQIGIIIASLPFLSFIWGIVRGRFNFKIEPVTINFNNLPKAFDGLKIIQISDIHIGSFKGFDKQVEEAVALVNAQQPDLILFTGDLYNNFYEELEGWTPILQKLHAPMGKYAVLGNHDYGKYYTWPNKSDEEANFANMQEGIRGLGFKLLNNEADVITVRGESIAIVGVENWGLPPFPQRGNYTKAAKNIQGIPFKILLSHDPNHWDQKIAGKTDVDLTLSGHTHGMQFGIQIAGYKWSPSKYKYKYWSGLYQDGNQFLYVNTGLGFIGYPGRVGMPPEITVFELKSK
jgi:predicted MPP superfamily phosphohydrolase